MALCSVQLLVGGQGATRVERSVTVTIPPGVDTGNRLRVAGEGEGAGAGAGRGDLYVFISVREHAQFQRDGADVYSQLESDFVDARAHAPAVKFLRNTQDGADDMDRKRRELEDKLAVLEAELAKLRASQEVIGGFGRAPKAPKAPGQRGSVLAYVGS